MGPAFEFITSILIASFNRLGMLNNRVDIRRGERWSMGACLPQAGQQWRALDGAHHLSDWS